ncbi:MAG TPA: twin-arginine translocase subunit TatC [Candidatus Acidoferrum sp.]|jgi:sec-independent protein translocase protein TatC|nr:twin-arginine translocase subunit TatC [Candidatus Acidoferrum sp.]
MTNSSQSDSPIVPLEEEPGAQMTFFEHLVELRKRIISSLVSILIGAMIGWFVAPHFVNVMVRPMVAALKSAHLDPKLVYSHPAGYLNLLITVSIYLGIVIASPWVLYQIWLFVAPALYKHERSAITGFLFSTVFLFLAGIAFGYFISLPYVLRFLISFQGPVVPLINIDEYFDLILLVLLGLGLVFELPILIFFLSLFGVVTPEFLIKNVRYALLVIAILAAVLTPTPDATTMVLFMLVLLALYFLGVGVSWVVVRKRRRRLATAAEVH